MKLLSGSQVWQWAGPSRGLGSCGPQPRLCLPLQLGTPSPLLGTAFLPVFCKIKLNPWSSLPRWWVADGTSRRMDPVLSLLIARDLCLVSAHHVTSLLLPLTLWLFTLHLAVFGVYGMCIGYTCHLCLFGGTSISKSSSSFLEIFALAGSYGLTFSALLPSLWRRTVPTES